MHIFVIERLGQLAIVLVAVSIIAFFMVRLIPGDPAQLLAGPEASIEVVEQIRAKYALDRPIPVQYVQYVVNIARGDFGTSLRTRRPVITELVERYPSTLQLALTSVLLAAMVGIILGIVSASRRGFIDGLLSIFSTFGISMPSFWLGLVLMSVFSMQLGWLPAGGKGSILHLILPSIALAVPTAAFLQRLVRAQVRDELAKVYVRVAQSKGVSQRGLLYKHILRNAMPPILTLIAIQFGRLLGGAVVTETVFAWPGLGRLILIGIQSRDYPLIQASVLWMAVTFLLVNTLVDMLYGWLDPRIRYA